MDKEVAVFILKAIETMSLAIMKDDYDIEEMDKIYQMASIHLYDLD